MGERDEIFEVDPDSILTAKTLWSLIGAILEALPNKIENIDYVSDKKHSKSGHELWKEGTKTFSLTIVVKDDEDVRNFLRDYFDYLESKITEQINVLRGLRDGGQ